MRARNDRAVLRFIRFPGGGWSRIEGWRRSQQAHWLEVLTVANVPKRKPGEPYNGRRAGGKYTPDSAVDAITDRAGDDPE